MANLQEEQQKLITSKEGTPEYTAVITGDLAATDPVATAVATVFSRPHMVGDIVRGGVRVHSQSTREPIIASLEASWIETHLPKQQIAIVKQLAESVFGDEEIAAAWLREPNLVMYNKRPIDLLGTEDGFDRVRNLLLRIQYGVLA